MSYGYPSGQYGAPPPGQYQQPPPGPGGFVQPSQPQPPYHASYGQPSGHAPPPSGPYGAPASGYHPPPCPGGYGAPPPPPMHAHPGSGVAPAPYAPGQTQFGGQAYGAPQPPPQLQNLPLYLGAPTVPPGQPVPHSLPTYNPQPDCDAIYKACKGFGTDEKALISVLARTTGDQAQVLAAAYPGRSGKTLDSTIEKELKGDFEYAARVVALGPLGGDVFLLHRACVGAGTNEQLLNELLIGRHPVELKLLRDAYRAEHNKSLDDVVQGELSMKTRDAFNIILQGRWDDGGVPNPQMVEQDVERLHKALSILGNTSEIDVCSIIFTRSPVHLQAVIGAYRARHHRSLLDTTKACFHGHMEDALMHALTGAEDGTGVRRDAQLLEAAMAGIGTKEKALAWRVARYHWEKPRWRAVQGEYQAKHRTTLASRIKGETRGDLERILVAQCEAV